MSVRKYVVLVVTAIMISTAFFSFLPSSGSPAPSVSVTGHAGRMHTSALQKVQVVEPANLTHYIPVTFYNNQSTPTHVPFDQEITVNSSHYSTYEAPNLQNVLWFTYNGNVIPSWIEYGDSSSSSATIYWLRLPTGIGAHSAVTVYMGFEPASTNLFNATGNEGVYPSATSTYAQYDNGAVVFPVYFNGNAPLSQFSVYNSISLSRQTSTMPGNNSGDSLLFSGTTYTRSVGWVYSGSHLSLGNYLLGAMFRTSHYNNTLELDLLNTNLTGSSSASATGVGTNVNSTASSLYSMQVDSGSWHLNLVSHSSPDPTQWIYLNDLTNASYNLVYAGTRPYQALASGTYPSDPVAGMQTVFAGSFWADSDGNPMNQYIGYERVSYAPPGSVMPSWAMNSTANVSLDVYENGLPIGTEWYVSYGNSTFSTNGSSMHVLVSYGTANLTFYSPGFHAFPGNTSVNAVNSNETVGVTFSRYSFLNPGYIKSTLFLGNGTLVPGSPMAFGPGNGTGSVVYSGSNNMVYASDPLNNSIVYFNKTGVPRGNISTGSPPGDMLYDPVNSMVYVAEPSNSSVLVVNTTTESVAATIQTGNKPVSMAFNPSDNGIYVANELSGTISLINGTGNTVAGSFSVQVTHPDDILYSTGSNELYITGMNLTYIGVLSSSGKYTEIFLPSGITSYPYSTYDPNSGIAYISVFDEGSGTSRIIRLNTTDGLFSGYAQNFYPNDENYAFIPFYDRYNNLLYAGSTRDSYLSYEQPGQPPGGRFQIPYSSPYSGSMAISPSGSYMYYPETGTNSVAVISLKQYQVLFYDDSVLLGQTLSVTMNTVTEASGLHTALSFITGNGTFRYTAKVTDRLGQSSSTSGTITVQGIGKTVYLTLSLGSTAGAVSNFFYEAGLPYGQKWTVRIGGVNNTETVLDKSIRNEAATVILMLQGQYHYSIYSRGYRVVSRDAFMQVIFPGGYTKNDYLANFDGIMGSGLLNNTYNFGVYIVFFLPVYYSITFHETGLAPGTYWDVTSGGVTAESASAYLNLSLTNGTHAFSVGTTGTGSPAFTGTSGMYGYSASPGNGLLIVNGANITVNVTFRKLAGFYDLNVTFSHFPTDYYFGATIGNRSEYSIGEGGFSSPAEYINFLLKNGSYSARLSAIPNDLNGVEHYSSYGGAKININGSNSTYDYIYSTSPGTYTVTLKMKGLPPGVNYPLNVVEKTSTGTQSVSVIQNSSHTMTMALSNGTYTVRYQQMSYQDYYYGRELYWQFLKPGSSMINFNSTGYMRTAASAPLTLNYPRDYYLKPVTFSVSGSNRTVNVNYFREYSINISINGPEGGFWSVVIGNNTYSSLTHYATIHTINGSYGYTVRLNLNALHLQIVDAPGYSPGGGNLVVDGHNITIKIKTRQMYAVDIVGSIPAVLRYVEVNLSGSQYRFSGQEITEYLPNGTYNYTVTLPEGFTSTRAQGNVVVDGNRAYISFSVQSLPLSSTIAGYTPYYLIGILSGILVSAVVISALYIRRKLRR